MFQHGKTDVTCEVTNKVVLCYSCAACESTVLHAKNSIGSKVATAQLNQQCFACSLLLYAGSRGDGYSLACVMQGPVTVSLF